MNRPTTSLSFTVFGGPKAHARLNKRRGRAVGSTVCSCLLEYSVQELL